MTQLEYRTVDDRPARAEHRIGAAEKAALPWPVVVIVAVTASGLAWLRIPEQVAGQLYAEDGPLFLAQAATDGSSALLAPYGGYQHLLPRLFSATIATVVPVADWAVATNAAVCLALGLVAVLVLVCSREVTRSPGLRILLALLPALAPFARVEALGNLANLHWFLLYALVWLLVVTPRSPVGASLTAVATLVVMLSETQGVLLLPLVGWRLWRDGRRVWPVALAWAIGALVQVASYLSAPRVLPPGRPPWPSVLEGYALNVGLGSFSVRVPVLDWVIDHTGLWAGASLVVLGVVLVVLAAVSAAGPARVAVIALAYGSVASWMVSFVLGANFGYYYSELPWTDWMLVRWGTSSSLLFLAAVLVSLDVVGRHRRPLRVPAATAQLGIVVLLVVGAPWDLPTAQDTWQARAVQARNACVGGAGEVIVTSAPALGWQMRLPCSLLL